MTTKVDEWETMKVELSALMDKYDLDYDEAHAALDEIEEDEDDGEED